jgi:hypothetical protein
MSQCQYRYNPSETYQRTKPGMAPETICGARTYPAIDEDELLPVTYGDGRTEFQKTGRQIARGYDDPYCPMHGGSPEPPPLPVTMPELENAYTRYLELSRRYQGAVPIDVPDPYQIATGTTPQLPGGNP